MFLRWLHKAWKYFWTTVLALVIIIVVVTGSMVGLLQLNYTQDYLAERIETSFNERFQGKVSIGRLSGFLPFRIAMDEVNVTTSKTVGDTVLSVQSLNADIDPWNLLQNTLSIRHFEVSQPDLRLSSDPAGGYTIGQAFQLSTDTLESGIPQARGWITQVEVLAPTVQVREGSVFIEKYPGDRETLRLPEPLTIESINLSAFLELSTDQRFLDIDRFSMRAGEILEGEIQLAGQVYNDRRFLEFNSFSVTTPLSDLEINGEVDGVDLYRPDLARQIRDAYYNLDIQSTNLQVAELQSLFPKTPKLGKPVNFNLEMEGVIDSLWVERLSVGLGESFLRIDGKIEDLLQPRDLAYEFKVRNLYILKNDLQALPYTLSELQYQVLEKLLVEGEAGGTADSLNVDIRLESPAGRMELDGFTELRPPYRYRGSISGRDLNLNILPRTGIDSSRVNLDLNIDGVGINPRELVMDLSANVYNSSVNDVTISEADLTVSMVEGFLREQFTYRDDQEVISGSGWLDLNKEEYPMSIEGYAQNIDLSKYVPDGRIPETGLDFDFEVQTQGAAADRLQGRANLDIHPSKIGNDSVRAHQIYVDLDSPDQESRTLRLTSSLFDMNLTGDIKPTVIADHLVYWKAYLDDRIRREIALDGKYVAETQPPSPNEAIRINGDLTLKDLNLIGSYLSSFPDVVADTRLEFDINADSTRLLVSAEATGDTVQVNEFRSRGVSTQLTASFRHDRTLKEFSVVDFQAGLDRVTTNLADLDSVNLGFSMKRDALELTQTIGKFSQRASASIRITGKMSEDSLQMDIGEFHVGNSEYAWEGAEIPRITYLRGGDLKFRDFRFRNQDEFFALQGKVSQDRSDSLKYIVRNVNLARISELVKGRVSFDGIMNGTFVTRSLTRRPSVQGNISVNGLAIEDRIIGDARFSSRFNQQNQRFETNITILTDSTRYADYLDRNDDVGQRIFIDGYFVPPNPEVPQDTVYHFDIDFDEIDLWVLEHIAHKAFDNVEGVATGGGYFTGNLDDYDFHADFQVDSAYVKPKFLNTNYYLDGEVRFDRQNWLVLDSLDVRDDRGGNGLVYGTIDLKNFSPISEFDLTLQMDQLHFLNNPYDPDVPFYGSLSGSGLVRLTGLNTDLFLQSIEPIQVTPGSKLSIPLLEETELTETRGFIQFVDTFDVDRRSKSITERAREEDQERETINALLDNLRFTERVNLDLQFNARDPMSVELIFDPATGDILTADGTGQLRLQMQEEDVQMFGRFNITGGVYNFVSGDIITRRLSLEPGGTISWQGDPDNARLNIQAVYQARPNIGTLTAGNTGSQGESGQSQRIPIELVVQITGTITSPENDYFFRMPNTLDTSSNTALAARISDINRNEEEKLFQATSILMTGQFINVSSSNEASSALTQNLSRGSTYVNPLLSSQIISPLLSSQINALLSSDVNRFDVDFNLNAYNEIDLGVALRLYNDKLILRREGQITGNGTENSLGERIGDINATYRINRGLSVTAFHRQDQSLSNVTASQRAGDVSATVDGVGLEAQVQFNTWREIARRIRRTIRGIFGARKSEEEQKNETLVNDGSTGESKDESN